jgi:hypothetical protein
VERVLYTCIFIPDIVSIIINADSNAGPVKHAVLFLEHPSSLMLGQQMEGGYSQSSPS